MFGANNFCKQLVRLLLAPFSFISLLLLSACGGGGSSTSIPQDTGISVTSVQSDSYKELTPAQSAGASFPSDTLVELPSDANLGVGNVVVVNDRIVKLSSIETGAASGKIRYGFTSAQLDDIFKSLTLDGSVSAESVAVAPVARTLAVKGKTTCGLSASVMNLPGVACNFNLSSNPGPLSLDGNASFGGRLDFKAWDVIRNTGSGNIEISFDGDIAVRLKKESAGLLPENDVCSSTRDEVVGARARLFTLSLPTNVPTVSVRIPFCLAMDAKAGITGKLFQFKQQGLLKIAVGEKSMPRITSTLPSSSATTKAEDAESWTIDSQTTTISLIPVDVSASAALSAEIAVEVAASLASHPKATMTATGLVASFIGTGDVTGKFAVVENIGKTIAAMGIDPLYCLKIGVGVDFQSTIYVSLPAFKIFFGPDYTFSRNLFASPVPIWSSSAPIGKCDFKVNTQTTITSVSKPGGQVDFSVKVVKNDPSAGRLWDDRQSSGNVTLMNSAGEVLCTVALASGEGKCSYNYPVGSVDRTEIVLGKYLGDDYFRYSENNANVQVVRGVRREATETFISVAEVPSRSTDVTVEVNRIVSVSPEQTMPIPTGEIVVATRDGRRLCSATLPVGASRVSCRANFTIDMPAQFDLVANYMGDALFLPSTSKFLPHILGGDFAFAFSPLTPGAVGESLRRCETKVITEKDGWLFSGSGSVSIDYCYTDVKPFLRCSGPGCGTDRFYITGYYYSDLTVVGCFPVPGNLCKSVSMDNANYVDIDGYSAINDGNLPRYIAGAINNSFIWRPLLRDVWMVPALGIISGFMALNGPYITTNFRSAGEVNYISPNNSGDVISRDHYFKYMIYDLIEHTYTPLEYRFSQR